MSSKKLIVLLVGMTLLAGGGFAALKLDRTEVSYFACRVAFQYYLHRNAREIEKETHSGESGVYYFTSYYLHGMLSAVEATGSERLLRQVMRYLDTMLATAQTIQNDGQTYKAWGPFVITPQSDVQKPIAHYTLQAMVPVARCAAVIMRNPKFRAKYASQAQRYIQFADSSVIQYWYIGQFHRRVPWLDAEVPVWNDNATNMGLVATFLYQASGDPVAWEVASAVGHAFQSKLAPQGRGWVWESQTITIGSDTDNTPGSVGNQAGVPDTSHTNREPMLMISLHEAGILFSEDDIRRMGYTLVDTLWNRSYEDPSFANYLNGSDKPYRVYKEPGLNGAIYHGWALVGGYCPAAQDVLAETLKAIFLGKKNPSLERNTTSYGATVGLSGHLLRNYRLLLSAEGR
jgi:hypothetical protein